jgi:multicomponent Na+:H+ antiporter subunit D
MINAPLFFVFIPIFASIFVFLINHIWVRRFLFVIQISMIVMFVLYTLFLIQNPDQNLIIFGGWDAKFAISFYNDGLSLPFIGLSILMWTVMLIYTYKTNRNEHKFLFFFMFLEGIFLGLIQTNDLFNLFVFLELMTVLITILIVYKKTGPSFRAGIFYLLVNTIGAMFFLLGIIFIYYVYGTINIQILKENIHLFSDRSIIKLAFVMMISGLSIKAAFFPLFTWLPKAHGVAQSTISALLSGLIVKGALYMFARISLDMFLGASYPIHEVMFYIGAITSITGVVFALVQKDIKQILAYHTVSQVGIMVMGMFSGSYLSYFGGMMHIFNHALFKSLLFLGAGVVISRYHTKKVTEIRGVLRTMPITGILLIVGMLSISGAPLFNGFISKSLVKYDFKYDTFKMILFTIINIGTVTSFLKFSQILFGPKTQSFIESDRKQQFAMTILGILCLGIGIFYLPLGQALFNIDLSYVKVFSLVEFRDYLLYVMIGLMIYRHIIIKDYKPLKNIRNLSISFENANYMFILYMVFIAVFIFMIA